MTLICFWHTGTNNSLLALLINIKKFSVSFKYFPSVHHMKTWWCLCACVSLLHNASRLIGVYTAQVYIVYVSFKQRILTLLTVYDLPHTCPDLFLSGLLSDIVVPEEPELSSVVGGALRILLFRQSHQRLGKMAAAPIKELSRYRGRLETFGFFLLLFVNLGNCLF